ncbi:MAG: hypothetical protein JKY08_03040 [Flavobacteriaceae bacterium]|nr:hypothetical protein [Flavobacteriaceae bacterium]
MVVPTPFLMTDLTNLFHSFGRQKTEQQLLQLVDFSPRNNKIKWISKQLFRNLVGIIISFYACVRDHSGILFFLQKKIQRRARPLRERLKKWYQKWCGLIFKKSIELSIQNGRM